MGRGACQLGRTAGAEIGEEESGGFISGGRERTWEKGKFVATGAMRELRQGFWAFHAMWEVQSGDLLFANVSGRSLQRAQGRMSSHKYSFKKWFGDEIERSSTSPLLIIKSAIARIFLSSFYLRQFHPQVEEEDFWVDPNIRVIRMMEANAISVNEAERYLKDPRVANPNSINLETRWKTTFSDQYPTLALTAKDVFFNSCKRCRR